jgi:hypothetical protein
MSSAQRFLLAGVATLAAFSGSTTVRAAESSPVVAALDTVAPMSIARLSHDLSTPLPSLRRNPFGSAPVAAGALAERRGGSQVFNDNQLKGVVADNQATNVSTGMNVVSEGSFAGSAGIPTLIQNSGNNVLIQNATIVNVQVK